MAERIDSKTRKEIRALFSDLVGPVRVVFFTRKHPCPACREQQRLLTVHEDRLIRAYPC